MCEIAPGVYTAPKMTSGVRDRIRLALPELCPLADGIAILMTWADKRATGGQSVWCHGVPRVEIVEHDEIHLVRRPLSDKELTELKTELK